MRGVWNLAMQATTDKQDPHFDTAHLMNDVHARSFRGGIVTLAVKAGKFVLQLLSTIVLARLLRPKDFGLVAMVTAITGFVAIFQDLGLSNATVQRLEITHAQVSMLFWVNFLPVLTRRSANLEDIKDTRYLISDLKDG